jgi:hypothetical protein
VRNFPAAGWRRPSVSSMSRSHAGRTACCRSLRPQSADACDGPAHPLGREVSGRCAVAHRRRRWPVEVGGQSRSEGCAPEKLDPARRRRPSAYRAPRSGCVVRPSCDFPRPLHSIPAPRALRASAFTPRREPCPAPASHRPSARRVPTPLSTLRPMADLQSGRPFPGAPRGSDHRETRDGYRLAPDRLATVVALAIPISPIARPPADRCRPTNPHPANVA